jgi:hypothetical protein
MARFIWLHAVAVCALLAMQTLLPVICSMESGQVSHRGAIGSLPFAKESEYGISPILSGREFFTRSIYMVMLLMVSWAHLQIRY